MTSSTFFDKVVKIVLKRCDEESVRKEVKIILKRCDEDKKLQKYLNAGRDKVCNVIPMQCDDNIQKLKKRARSMVPWLPQRAEIEIPNFIRTKS